jgi:hypothetical protein
LKKVLELSSVSKRLKFVFSAALVVVGYVPSFVGLFATEVLSDGSASDSVLTVEREGSAGSVESVCINFPEPCKESLLQELLLCNRANNIGGAMCTVNTVAAVDDIPKKSTLICSKKSVSPIKIITGGEFSGAKFVKSVVKSNFYCDARRLGIPAAVVDSVIHNMSSKIDFRRSLKRGDEFEIIYDSKNVMLYSRIITKRKQASVYRVTEKTGSFYCFDTGVKVMQKLNSNAFVPPLKGKLCVSSAFGARVHPIRHVRHMHTGVDLKAQYGSPVYAIFDGVVTRASPYDGYGNCIDINHSSGYSSRYAHLSKYAVRSGARVKKGQLIGYTGSSGTSTGPHLHLELAKNNSVLNPLSIKMMPIEVQTVSNMTAFGILKKKIEKISLTK